MDDGGQNEPPKLSELFQKRAAKHRKHAGVLFAIIICLLAVGAVAFVFARSLTDKDLRRVMEQTKNLLKEKMERIKSDIDTLRNDLEPQIIQALKESGVQELKNVEKDCKCQDITGNILDLPRAIHKGTDQAPSYVELLFRDTQEVILRTTDQKNQHFLFRNKQIFIEFQKALSQEPIVNESYKYSGLMENLRDTESQLKTLEKEYANANAYKENDVSKEKPLESMAVFLIQTNLNKFGPILIILLLVSIMKPLYHYNMRLSAFYEARADALLLLRDMKYNDHVNFETVMKTMTPEIDFARSEKSLVEQASEIVKDVLKGFNSKK